MLPLALAPPLASTLLAPTLMASTLLAAPPPATAPAPPAAQPASTLVALTSRPAHGSWLPPVGALPVAVVHPFRAPPDPYAAGHRGVDLAAAVGEAVRAPAAGRVLFAGQVAGRPLVVLLHAGGLRTTYEPVAASVQVGEQVASGALLGTVVSAGSHCLPAACLHWGVRTGSGSGTPRYLDPMTLLAGRGPVRLLPLDGHRH